MKYYVVDAFASELFKGNPAGVCLLEECIPDEVMQKIAFENNLAETAFLEKKNGYYGLRWFTPEVEIDLCGHATLASAFVLMNYVELGCNQMIFQTKSGRLTVTKEKDLLVMDFPSRKATACQKPECLEKALGVKVLETYGARDILAVVENESVVAHMKPDFALLREIKDVFAVIVTAKGEHCDFVSRFFAPNAGIDEDPVTGSAHSTLIPYWSERLGKTDMEARQLSKRGGQLYCKDLGERVLIGGHVVCYLIGELRV